MSVGNALRGVLAAVLKGRAASSLPWRERLAGALKELGAEGTATAMLKYIERQEWKERRCVMLKNHVEAGVAIDCVLLANVVGRSGGGLVGKK